MLLLVTSTNNKIRLHSTTLCYTSKWGGDEPIYSSQTIRLRKELPRREGSNAQVALFSFVLRSITAPTLPLLWNKRALRIGPTGVLYEYTEYKGNGKPVFLVDQLYVLLTAILLLQQVWHLARLHCTSEHTTGTIPIIRT